MEKQNTQQPEVYLEYVIVQNFLKIQKASKKVRKGLARATEV